MIKDTYMQAYQVANQNGYGEKEAVEIFKNTLKKNSYTH